MLTILTNEEKVGLTVVGKTSAGNPATIDGIPVWTVLDSSVATLVASGDGLTVSVVSGVAGATTVTVTVGELLASVDVKVNAAGVATLEIVAGTPEPK